MSMWSWSHSRQKPATEAIGRVRPDLYAERGEKPGGGFRERIRLEVLESGSDLLAEVGLESALPIKLPITITYYPIRRHFACFPRPRHSTDFSNAMSFNTFRIMSRLTSGHLLCSSFT